MIQKIFFILIAMCVRCRSYSPRMLLSCRNSFHSRQLHHLHNTQYNEFHQSYGCQTVVKRSSSVASVHDGRVYEVTRGHGHDIKDRLKQSIVSSRDYLRLHTFYFILLCKIRGNNR